MSGVVRFPLSACTPRRGARPAIDMRAHRTALCAVIRGVPVLTSSLLCTGGLIAHSIHNAKPVGRPAANGGGQKMSLSEQTPRSIEIVPLTLHIGAEIRGVDLTKPLPPQQVKDVRDAFLKWKVVFFRNQHLDHAQHV